MDKKLTVKNMCALCVGKDFWHTAELSENEIPSLTLSDGPHGLRKQDDSADHLGIHDSITAICFPSASCLASSFDKDAAYRVGKLLGEEALSEGVHILLGPAINIKRSPLCGRNFEYYSEDPYLTGELAAQTVKGIQSHGVGACVKHFAANNQENGRMTVSANMDERTLREIYLRAFERVIREKPAAVMSSYNRINGEYVGESKRLLTDILRNEWGFDGIVISDWYAVRDRVASLMAGLDLEMPGYSSSQTENLAKAAEKDEVFLALSESANRVAATAKRLYREKVGTYDKEKHHKEAVSLASESAVLLKNEGFFPIKQEDKVLFIGEYAEKPRFQGGGSSHINAYRADGVFQHINGFNVDYFDWCKDTGNSACAEYLKSYGGRYDKIIVFAGLSDECESEGYDRDTLKLPARYDELLFLAAESGAAAGAVLFNGSPVAMPWLDKVKGVLEMGLAGEGAGEACAQIITGAVNPSGKLAETYPVCLEHTPAYLNSTGTRDVYYNEGVFVGYRYYSTKNIPTLFPFGFGLSYTKFAYSALEINSEKDEITVEFKIKNIGSCFGKETAQLYIMSNLKNRTDRPKIELKRFEKVSLDVGEEKCVHFTLKKEDFAFYDVQKGRFITMSGEYEIIIAASAEEFKLRKTVFIDGEILPPEIDELTTVGDLLQYPPTAEFIGKCLKGFGSETTDNDAIGAKMKRAMIFNAPIRLIKGIAKMSDERYRDFIEELKRLTLCKK